MEHAPGVGDIERVIREGEMLGIPLLQFGCETAGCEPLSGPGHGTRGQVHARQAARAAPGPLHMIGSHAYADLKDILAGPFIKPGEASDVRLETVTRFRVLTEPLFSAQALRVDLATRRCVPEPADL